MFLGLLMILYRINVIIEITVNNIENTDTNQVGMPKKKIPYFSTLSICVLHLLKTYIHVPKLYIFKTRERKVIYRNLLIIDTKIM